MIARLTGSFLLRALLTAGVLVLLASRIDLRATGQALLRLDPVMAGAVLLLLALDRVTMIWRWIILLRARGTGVSAKSATWIYLVSSFIGGYTAVAGDAARAFALSRRTAQGSNAVASVAVDRLLGLLSILAIALVGVFLAGRQMGEDTGRTLTVVSVVIVSAGAAVLFADHWVRVVFPRAWHATRPADRVFRLADALAAYRGHRAALASVALLSVGVQVLRIVQAYLLGIGIGIEVPFSYYLLFMPVGLIALMLPISIAGFGVPQGVIVWLLQPRGVPEPDSLALSTLIVLTGILANLPGAVLYLRAGKAADPAGTS